MHRQPAFRSYSIARKQVFVDYAYVIYLTGPAAKYEGKLTMPDGFQARPLAARLLSLGRRWAHLYEESWDREWERECESRAACLPRSDGPCCQGNGCLDDSAAA